MKVQALPAYNQLIANLQELILSYRDLYELVLEEHSILIGADREKLEQNNQKKEKYILRLQLLDLQRKKISESFCQTYPQLNQQSPRLLEIAEAVGGEEGKILKDAHQALDTLVRRVAEQNKANSEYAESALRTLNGAIENVKETLAGKKTYEKKGKYKKGPDVSGNFISKNV